MRSFRVLLLIGIAAALVPSAASAQSGPGIQMVMSIGGGPGSAQFRCDDCLDQRDRAAAGYLRLARRIRPAWVVGVEANAWYKETEQGDGRNLINTVDATVQWYPRRGFFVVGGLGVGSFHQEADVVVQSVAYTIVQEGTKLGWHAGAGYEFQIAEHAALAPFATLFGTQGIKFEDLGKFNTNVFLVGVGLTIN